MYTIYLIYIIYMFKMLSFLEKHLARHKEYYANSNLHGKIKK